MKAFERNLILPFTRGLFNLYGAAGFIAILFGIGSIIYSQTKAEIMPRQKWIKSGDEEAVNTRDIITSMSTSYNSEEEEKIIEKSTEYMYNNPEYTSRPVEKTKYHECLSKSTYKTYNPISNPNNTDPNTFPWSVWRTDEFEKVLRDNDIDLNTSGEGYINSICKQVHTSDDPLKPKHVNTNTTSGYSPWMDLGYRIMALRYADARYDDYSNRVTSENLKKSAALPLGLWSIAGGTGAVALASFVISFMGIESNLRELEKIANHSSNE